jgi:hypothetical protein
MKSERDTTRIVRSWLEDGSTAMPDRVFDAVLSELPSTPQRRGWSPWRYLNMKPMIALGAGAAVIVVAVLLGNGFLPGDTNVGGPPTSSNSPLPTAIGGQVAWGFGDDRVSVDLDGTQNGSSLTGTAMVSSGGQQFTIELECVRRSDDTTWMLGGDIIEGIPGAEHLTRAAVVVRDPSPQQVVFFFEDPPPAADCLAFLEAISADDVQTRSSVPWMRAR